MICLWGGSAAIPPFPEIKGLDGLIGNIVKAAKDLLCPSRSLTIGENPAYACQAVLRCGQEESG